MEKIRNASYSKYINEIFQKSRHQLIIKQFLKSAISFQIIILKYLNITTNIN